MAVLTTFSENIGGANLPDFLANCIYKEVLVGVFLH